MFPFVSAVSCAAGAEVGFGGSGSPVFGTAIRSGFDAELLAEMFELAEPGATTELASPDEGARDICAARVLRACATMRVAHKYD